MKRVILTTVAICTMALAACDKPATDSKDDTTSKNATTTGAATANGATTAAAPTAVTPAPTATPVTIADSDLSTPADFEEAAEKAITPKTYKTELASLETSIANDKE